MILFLSSIEISLFSTQVIHPVRKKLFYITKMVNFGEIIFIWQGINRSRSMNVDEVIDLLKARLPESLTPLQEVVLRSTWDGKTYADMAAQTNYVKEYLSRTASELWSNLSDYWGEPIGKHNFRRVFESRPLSKEQQQSLLEFRRQSTTSWRLGISDRHPKLPLCGNTSSLVGIILIYL